MYDWNTHTHTEIKLTLHTLISTQVDLIFDKNSAFTNPLFNGFWATQMNKTSTEPAYFSNSSTVTYRMHFLCWSVYIHLFVSCFGYVCLISVFNVYNDSVFHPMWLYRHIYEFFTIVIKLNRIQWIHGNVERNTYLPT